MKVLVMPVLLNAVLGMTPHLCNVKMKLILCALKEIELEEYNQPRISCKCLRKVKSFVRKTGTLPTKCPTEKGWPSELAKI